jgi:hypothetical protein
MVTTNGYRVKVVVVYPSSNVSKSFSFKLSKASFLQCSNIASLKIVKTVMTDHMARNVIAVVIFD